MAKKWLALFLFLNTHSAGFAQQVEAAVEQSRLAKVEVTAFEASGRFLGPPNVIIFESAAGVNMSSRFRGGVASGIPYGTYRLEARLPWYFSDVSYVMVFQQQVTIVVGLRFSTELPNVPLMLTGTVTGVSREPEAFAKILGVYEHISVESPIDKSGGFSFGGLAPGLYVLWIVGEKGILASQALTIPYLGDPLLINAGARVPPP